MRFVVRSPKIRDIKVIRNRFAIAGEIITFSTRTGEVFDPYYVVRSEFWNSEGDYSETPKLLRPECGTNKVYAYPLDPLKLFKEFRFSENEYTIVVNDVSLRREAEKRFKAASPEHHARFLETEKYLKETAPLVKIREYSEAKQMKG